MKKIIRLTESDIRNMVKRVIKESTSMRSIDIAADLLQQMFVEEEEGNIEMDARAHNMLMQVINYVQMAIDEDCGGREGVVEDDCNLEEEGEAGGFTPGGATNVAGVGGQYTAPFGGVQKRDPAFGRTNMTTERV